MSTIDVDCASLVMTFLQRRDAICLSRCHRFFLSVAQRRASYRRPIEFPDFGENFDLTAYRRWQTKRRPLQMTMRQLVEWSRSTVMQRECDIELLIACESPFEETAESGHQLSSSGPADPPTVVDISDVISALGRFTSIRSLRLSFEPREPDAEEVTPDDPHRRSLFIAGCIDGITAAWASQLISFEVEAVDHADDRAVDALCQLVARLTSVEHVSIVTDFMLTCPLYAHLRFPPRCGLLAVSGRSDFDNVPDEADEDGVDDEEDDRSAIAASESNSSAVGRPRHLLWMDSDQSDITYLFTPRRLTASVGMRLRRHFPFDVSLLRNISYADSTFPLVLRHGSAPLSVSERLAATTAVRSSARDIQEWTLALHVVPPYQPIELTPITAFAHSLRHISWAARKPVPSAKGAVDSLMPPLILQSLLQWSAAGIIFPRLERLDIELSTLKPRQVGGLSVRMWIDLARALPALRSLQLDGLSPSTLTLSTAASIFHQLTHLSLTFDWRALRRGPLDSVESTCSPHRESTAFSPVLHAVATHLTRLTSLRLTLARRWCATGVMTRRVVDALTSIVLASRELSRIEIDVPMALIIGCPEHEEARVWAEKFRQRWVPTLLSLHLLWRQLQPSHDIPLSIRGNESDRDGSVTDDITQLLLPFLSARERREFTRRLAQQADLARSASAAAAAVASASSNSPRGRSTCGRTIPAWVQRIGVWLTTRLLWTAKPNQASEVIVEGEVNPFAVECERMATRVAAILQTAGRSRIESRVFTFALQESTPPRGWDF
jgi:hypothetical protein